jgi:hypothetical protein
VALAEGAYLINRDTLYFVNLPEFGVKRKYIQGRSFYSGFDPICSSLPVIMNTYRLLVLGRKSGRIEIIDLETTNMKVIYNEGVCDFILFVLIFLLSFSEHLCRGGCRLFRSLL